MAQNVFLLCPHRVEGVREFSGSLIRVLIPFIRALPQGRIGDSVSTYSFGGPKHSSVIHIKHQIHNMHDILYI